MEHKKFYILVILPIYFGVTLLALFMFVCSSFEKRKELNKSHETVKNYCN